MNKPKARLKINVKLTSEVEKALAELLEAQTDEKIIALCEKYKNTNFIKWKESVTKIINKV